MTLNKTSADMLDIATIDHGQLQDKKEMMNGNGINGHLPNKDEGSEKSDDSRKWAELTTKEKFERVAWGVLKGSAMIILLYFFICSLDLLSSSLQLLAGKTTGNLFQNELLTNPLVGLMIGVLATVLVQSSSTSTSIVVSMVAAGIIPSVELAIPIIMGANVGTSVTNTIVAITRIGDRAEFGRAFAGATVHDMFNWLSVIVLLTLEVTTGYLYHLTSAIVNSMDFVGTDTEIKTLQVITDPFTEAILLLDDEVLQGWALGNSSFDNATLLKIYCDEDMTDKCSMARVIQKTVNADIPYVPWLTGYLAIMVGAVCTFLMQSSSVFTSALTPLVGMGIISVSRVYPLTLGSNIGTTTTAMLAALTAPADKLELTIQVALCHLFFNVTGIIIYYPIPFMRWPIPLALGMGKTTAKYRWFAVAYLLFAFLLIPLFILGLSVADPSGITLIVVCSIAFAIILFVVVVKFLQKKWPFLLPAKLRTWKWLPLGLRSLEPTDRVLNKVVVSCKRKRKTSVEEDLEAGEINHMFELEENKL
ncbi:hypothetical protein B566_EDAN000957 [Ephemera danica]|nr:hypothetical protein B566_EDAN000957 [Ephemera danica]